MDALKIKGFVLRGDPFGESHKMITLFSDQLGKIKVIAHGVRKTKSKYGSTFELLNEVSLVITPTKEDNLYNIKDFGLNVSTHPIRDQFESIQLLYYIAEFLYYFIHPNNNDLSIYQLLHKSLNEAIQHPKSHYAIFKSFEIKSLKILGFLSNIKVCSHCENKLSEHNKERIFFSERNGWIFCQKCCNPKTDKEVTRGTYYFILNLLQYRLNDVFKLKIEGIFKNEINLAFKKLNYSILGKEFKSLKWLTPAS